jgi:anti-sigma factor RsiW
MGDVLRDALPTYEAPESLRAWARAQAPNAVAASPITRPTRLARRFAYAAAFVVAVGAGWAGGSLTTRARTEREARGALVASLVDTHVRSLMAGHLTDVQSSDHHTVKPWFAGKVAFSPRVPELAQQGFPLIGGRLDYVAGHPAVALVYGRGLHSINLFIWPTASGDAAPSTVGYHGYSLAHWTDREFTYWAVSDAAASEVAGFERAYTTAP